MGTQRLVKAVVLCGLGVLLLVACNREPEYAREPSAAEPVVPAQRDPAGTSTAPEPSDASPVLSDNQLAELKAQNAAQLEDEFLNQGLSAPDKAKHESEITQAFSGVPGVTIVEAVQCRQQSCRIVISAANKDAVIAAVYKVTGTPAQGNPALKGGPLESYGLTIAKIEEMSSSATATLYLRPPSGG